MASNDARGLGAVWSGCLAFLLLTIPACAEPIVPGEIDLIDGDTMRIHGDVVRLVGFDAPETGPRARCESERAKGALASRHLRMLVVDGGLDFTDVPCACAAGTQGTQRCNHGWSCGLLIVRGRDVAEIMVGEGLARKYVCGTTRCPKREGWRNG